MEPLLRAVVVFVVGVLMLVVLLFVGATTVVRVTLLSERFWVETASIALDAERLAPVVEATAVADIELAVGAAESIAAARLMLVLLGVPGHPVQDSVERFLTSVFGYLNGYIPIEQVAPVFSDEAIDEIASSINAGFARGDFDGISDLDYLRSLSSSQRREVIGHMVASLQEALDFHAVPLQLTNRWDPAVLRDLRSHYLDRQQTVNRALVSGVAALFILAAVILIAWRRDPLRGLRRVGIPFVILGALAGAAYAAVRFLGPSVTEQALRTLIEQPDTSAAEAATIVTWMVQVHRYLAAIYLRALQPVLVMAIVSLVAGVVLIVLPRFRTNTGFHSMTPE
jgi:hypothetical protein